MLRTPASRGLRTVMIYGDSLSSAFGLLPSQGWVARLGDRLGNAKQPWRVVSSSVAGETTANGLTRLPQSLALHKPHAVVVAYGTNDAIHGQPIAKMSANLEAGKGREPTVRSSSTARFVKLVLELRNASEQYRC